MSIRLSSIASHAPLPQRLLRRPARASVRLREEKRRAMWAYLFISPFFLGFLIFGLFPIGFSFYLAFTQWTPLGSAWVGLANFANLVQDSLFRKAIINSLWLMVAITVVQMGLGLIIAFVLNAKGLRFRQFFRTALFLPFITAPVVLGLMWGVIFAHDGGLLNYALGLVHIGPVDWLGTAAGTSVWIKPAIALVVIWQFTGWNVILFSAGLSTIPRELYEAATIDGASQLHVLTYITLPMLKRIFFFISSLAIIGNLQLFDVPLMLLGGPAGGGSGTIGGADQAGLTMTMNLYDTAFNYGQYGYAASMAIVLFAMAMIFTVLNRKAFFRDSEG